MKYIKALVSVLVLLLILWGSLWVRTRQAPVNQAPANTPAVNSPNDQDDSVRGDLTQTYQDSRLGFSVHYPTGYTVDPYEYQNPGAGPDIEGVRFIIPASLAAGTNLSGDSYIGVDFLRDSPTCRADLFMPGNATAPQNFVDANVTYSRAEFTGAAAGNRYEETVFALPGTNPCIAVHYTIHTTVIENYPAGTVKEFDKQALLEQYDKIRRSLVINQK